MNEYTDILKQRIYMPEGPPVHPDLYKSLKAKSKENMSSGHVEAISQKDVKNLVENYNASLVGSGKEAVVLSIEGKPKQVAAFQYTELPPNEVMNVFYTQRILSTLFPHNFPKFTAAYASDSQAPEQFAGTIRDRVEGVTYNRVLTIGDLEKEKSPEHPFTYVMETCTQLGLSIDFDDWAVNFAFTPSGEVVYMDKSTFTPNAKISIRAVQSYMESQPDMLEDKKRIVEKSLQRLADLGTVTLID